MLETIGREAGCALVAAIVLLTWRVPPFGGSPSF